MFTALRQIITLHDLKLAAHNDANKPANSIALLNSTSATLIKSDGTEIDVLPMTVFIHNLIHFHI